MQSDTRPRKKEPLDQQKINQFASLVMHDLEATAHSALAYIGDLLGFYKAMAKVKDNTLTSEELANLTGTNERYTRDWLAEQASKHYILYHPSTGAYSLPQEHAEVLVNEMSHYNLAGGFQLLISLIKEYPKIAESFRTGR